MEPTINYPEIYVEARLDEINNNNLEGSKGSPYSYFDAKTDEKVERPSKVTGTTPTCDMCFQVFKTFTDLYKHKAHPCYLDAIVEPPFENPIKVTFDRSQLFYIGDAIKELKLKLTDGGIPEQVYFIVDKSNFEITMRRLYVAQITKYNIEQWYPALEELSKKSGTCYTSATKWIGLDETELKLLQKLCSIKLATNLGMSSRETNAEAEARETLEDKISKFLGTDDVPYFCRLSTRSPKDGVSTSKDEKDGSLETRMQAKLNGLQVKNGYECIELVSKSQRIFSDIGLFFQYSVKNTSGGVLNLIFRDWVTEMPQDHEFRCFVHNKEMYAISQYHCYYVFEKLQDREHVCKIRDSIVEYHNKIKDCLPMPSYVIDIVVYKDYSCHVIELNPFGSHMSSGAALYNWHKDFDVLYGNDKSIKYPSIRVLKKLIEDDDKSEAQ